MAGRPALESRRKWCFHTRLIFDYFKGVHSCCIADQQQSEHWQYYLMAFVGMDGTNVLSFQSPSWNTVFGFKLYSGNTLTSIILQFTLHVLLII